MALTLTFLLGIGLPVLVAGSELCRRAPAKAILFLWLALPFGLLPLWLSIADEAGWTWFLWAKTYSVTSAVVWLMITRIWSSRLPSAAVRWPLYLFLGLNILEAVAKDALAGHLPNALAGALLIATMGRSSRISVSSSPTRDLEFDLGKGWVIAYTLWNVVFVYSNWHAQVAGQHLAVLGAALAIAIWTGWQRWFQARCFTLGLYLLAYDSFFFDVRAHLHTAALYSETVKYSLQIVSLIGVVVLLGYERASRGTRRERASHPEAGSVRQGAT